MLRSITRFFKRGVILWPATFLLAGCFGSFSPEEKTIPVSTASASLAEQGITVITTTSLHSYYEGKDGPDGMAFQLVRKFAEKNGYPLKILVTKNSSELFEALDQGDADIALTTGSISFSRNNQYIQSRPYMDVTSQLIYHQSKPKPDSFEDLYGKKILVQDNVKNREKYELFKEQFNELEWEFTNRSIDELLGMVNSGAIDYTMIDSHDFLGRRSLFTRTRVAFDLYYPEPVAFSLSTHANPALKEELDSFLAEAEQQGTIASLVERFYGHADDFNPKGSRSFFYLVNTRLPEYQSLIQQVAGEFRMDWRLLAAIAYQESHWDPEATSPTGVRGMMMLTNNTAADLGIEDRLDVESSLRGGARYFKQIYRQLPEPIREPDRTWFALAAYNVGLGHVLDARRITAFREGNPNRWVDVKRYLPLLEQEEWHQYTEFGYARGREPVVYVQNIRHFNSLLEWRFPLGKNEKKPVQASSQNHQFHEYLPDSLKLSALGR
jgi:membrane-bound lytic murein transglycosylase F